MAGTIHVVELPRDEGGLARFEAVAEAVRAEDPILGAGPPDDDASVLSASSEEGGAVPAALFVACDGSEPGERRDLARCAAMLPPRVPGDEPRRRRAARQGGLAGALGFWACRRGRDDAGRAVLEAARAWLFARGRDAVGPLDLSTWHRYRFVVEGFDDGRFLLEPWNRADEVRLWREAGFAPCLGHATVETPLVDVPALRAAHDAATALGVTFVDLATLPPDDALAALYDVVSAGFAQKTGFGAISRDRFFSLYAGAALLLSPRLSFLARGGDGRALGFAFAYPDWLEPLRVPGLESPRTTVVKTLARRPDAPASLGYALCHRHMVSARDAGYSTVLFALMERWAALTRVARQQGVPARVSKRYALFRSTRRPA